MRKLIKITILFAVPVTLLFAYGCNRKVAPQSTKIDKTRKLKCRCSKNKFPRSHYQASGVDFGMNRLGF
ncbi:MAG TPA: hypothetical protein ENN49_01940 [Bacteroidales bacterium]|nr:hypothetical protein [Bacteroidales bacterium]